MSRPAARILLVLGSAVAVLMLLTGVEWTLRALDLPRAGPVGPIEMRGLTPGHQLTVWDERRLFRLRPNTDFLGYYRLNGDGYRDGEIPSRRPETRRVLCLGDSCTFGLGVSEEETYAARLQHMLRITFGDDSFEVFNLGIPGYTSFQTRWQLEEEVVRLEPDFVVILQTGLNDSAFTRGPTDAEVGQQNRSLAVWVRSLRLARLIGSAAPRWDPGKGRTPGEPIRGLDRPRVSVEEFEENLRASVAAVEASGAWACLVAPVNSDATRKQRRRLVDRESEVEEIPLSPRSSRAALADPRPAFREVAPYPLYVDGIHPTAMGHTFIASSIFSALVRSDAFDGDDVRVRGVRAYLEARERGVVGAETGFASVEELARALPPRPRPLPLPELNLPVDENRRPFPAMPRILWGTPSQGRWWSQPSPPSEEELEIARSLAGFDRALRATPAPVDIRIGAAIQRQRENDIAAAIGLYSQVLEDDPANVEAHYRLGRALARAGRPGSAQEHLSKVVELAPESSLGLSVAGWMDLERGRFAEAEARFRRAAEMDPVLVIAHYGLGRSLLELGRLDEARGSLTTVLMIDRSEFPDVPALLARVEAGVGE